MSRDYFVTSDTHFNHEAIISRFDPPRDFNSLSEMNEVIISNWNRVVKTGDRVYHLGDVFFGSKEDFKTLWPRLNGQKSLIVGNHDDIKFMASGGFFRKVELWKIFRDFKILLSHIPQREDSFRGGCELNVHGHTHFDGSPPGPYHSVCVELTNYTPQSLESIRDKYL